MDRSVRHALAWLAWWLALFWLWLLLAGDWNRIEWIAAACGAAVAATVGEVARARAAVSVRVPLTWIARSWSVPPIVLADFGILVWVLVRSALRRKIHRGAFRAHEFPAGGNDPVSRGIRAWTTVVATYSPNCYVVDVESERRLRLVHDLVPWPPSEAPS